MALPPVFDPLDPANGLRVSTIYDFPNMFDGPSTQLMWELNEAAVPDEIHAQVALENPSGDAREQPDSDIDMQNASDEQQVESDHDDDHEHGNPVGYSDEEDASYPPNTPSGPGTCSPTITHTAMDDVADPSPGSSSSSEVWEIIYPSKKDCSLHKKAHTLIPHILPPERYWIAVLLHSANPKETRKEKDFVWLKGNRRNTVQTIWQSYREVTTEEEFKLSIHEERPDFQVTMEELDFYNDHLVVFRAVLDTPVIFLD